MSAQRIKGIVLVLAASALWGASGPLTKILRLYGFDIADVLSWRYLIGFCGLTAFSAALAKPAVFRIDSARFKSVLVMALCIFGVNAAFTWSNFFTTVANAIALSFTAPLFAAVLARLFLGDHWERSYADLEWRGEMPNRPMPWYFLAHDGKDTLGIGVRTQPGALVFWNADAQGVSLWADVRSGGVGVALGERTLAVCDVIREGGGAGRSPFETLRALAAKFRPDCVIELVWQACLTYDVESFHVRRLAEEELHLPYLKIVTDYSPSDSARILARVEALVEMARAKSE